MYDLKRTTVDYIFDIAIIGLYGALIIGIIYNVFIR